MFASRYDGLEVEVECSQRKRRERGKKSGTAIVKVDM
jgi:hypothetical protein